MLRLSKVRPGRAAYYLSTTRAGGGATSGLIEPDGKFQGTLGAALGLDGEVVEPVGLRALFSGVDPATGAVLDARHDRVSIAAFDCMFASPKSVSVLHALGAPDVVQAVREAHEGAVAGSLGYLERNAAFVRREGRIEKTIGFAGAAFVHRTSRASDPHLHTHLLVANLSTDAAGRWSAIDARPLFAHVAAAGSLYRAQLRQAITATLGVAWETRAQGFADLIGISPRALRGFSRRSAAIAAELERYGPMSRRAESVVADRTRPEKDIATPYEQLVDGWRERAYELGISRSAVRGLARHRGAEPGTIARESEVVSTEVARSAEWFERPFDRRELIRATCGRLEAGASVSSVEAAVDAHISSGELVRWAAARVHLRSVGALRFPAGIEAERFANRTTAELTHRLAAALESAEDASSLAMKGTGERGAFIATSGAELTRVYDELRVLAIEAEKRGLPIVGVAPSRLESLHLEATIGIDTIRWRDVDRLRNGSFVVVAEPMRCPLGAALALVEEAAARRMTVVVARGAQHDDGERPAGLARTAGALERHSIDDVQVSIAPDPTSAVAEIRRLSDAARTSRRATFVVAGNLRFGDSHSLEVIRPGQISRAIRETPGCELVVLGSARLLGPVIDQIPDGQRHHVVVAPISTATAVRSYVLEVAEPQRTRALLGRVPDAPSERAEWRARSKTMERDFELSRPLLTDRVRTPRTGVPRDLDRAVR